MSRPVSEVHAQRAREQGLRRLVERHASAAPGLLRSTAGAAPAPLRAAGIALDCSRQRLAPSDLAALHDLARAVDVLGAQRAMMQGAPVNASEGRAALHTALRAPIGDADAPADVLRGVHAELDRLRAFARAVRAGEWKGATGQPLTDVITSASAAATAGRAWP